MNRIAAWLEKRELELEVDEEFKFHLDLLCDHYEKQGLSSEEALESCLKRFGDVGRARSQCLAISRRSRPAMRILKVLFTLLFFSGVLVRVFRHELQMTHLGDVMMMVAISGHLFLYVRGLSPANFLSSNKPGPLRLMDRSQMPVPAFDEQKRTPTERVISE
ncbi:MAG TPA: permease prefix domain 1-containing protein [Pyrinomonadaceae bacterium]|nr:permease prefix domain 1-containing protein [Pyrinomonadaceae bacterium]